MDPTTFAQETERNEGAGAPIPWPGWSTQISAQKILRLVLAAWEDSAEK